MTPGRRDTISDFLRAAGWGAARIAPLLGDASTRRYFRLLLDGRTALLMDQPQNAEASHCLADATADERRALGYNALARLAGADCGRFIAIAEYLRGRGLSAPAIYAADIAQGLVLLEDLGEDLYVGRLAGEGDERAYYSAAIDALTRLHAEPAPSTLADGVPLRDYDGTALLAETDLLTEWFVPLALGRPASEDERLEHRVLWREALGPILVLPPVFVHRDYHAQNLIWLSGRQGAARAGMIDFQDAVAGAKSYDIVSLLEDARRDVTPEIAEAMMRRYLDEMRKSGVHLDEHKFRAEAAVMAAQRNAKIAGIFARLYERDGKPRYLNYLPRVWRYLNRDLEHQSLQPLRNWYNRNIPMEAREKLRTRQAA